MTLNKRFEKIVNEYIAEFCKKQDVELEYWVAEDIGGICSIGDMFLTFDNIRLDIDKEAPKGLITEWYWADITAKQTINYWSYIRGLRHLQL